MVFLASLIVLLVLLALDEVRFRERDKREAAEAILNDFQRQFDGFVSSAVRSSRRLAASIGPRSDLDQAAFAALVEETVSGPATLVRAEFAPDFVTRFVHPEEGNRVFIGQSPLARGNARVPDLSAEIARGFPVLKRIDLDKNGKGQLEVQAEIREAMGNSILSSALVSLVMDFELVVQSEVPALTGDDVEFLILTHPPGAAPPEIPEAWRTNGNFEPYKQVMRYPPGDFLLFLKPLNGWQPTGSEMAGHWMELAGVGALLLMLVVLANWFAVSRAATQSVLTDTRKYMSGILENLPGAAFTVKTPSGIAVPGPNDQLRFHNPEACKDLWGIDAAEFENDIRTFWSTVATSEDAERIAAAGARSMQKMAPFDEVWPILTPTGEEKWLLGRAVPTREDDGTTLWSAIVFDHTAQVTRQKELELHQEMVFRAQKSESVGQLTGGIAHDFNNLLAVILGNLELLSEDENDAERRASIESAIKAAQRGAHLTRSMLAFSGRSRLTPETLNLNTVLDETRNWMERTLPSSVSLATNVEPDSWPIRADRASTESAILNLVLNARDAMHGKGALTIETSNVHVSADDAAVLDGKATKGRFVVLSVSDTGDGITDDQIEKIFEPFFTTKYAGRGSGLGLSMVKGFMEQTGGWVQVESRPGQGATFKLYFPVFDAETPYETTPKMTTTAPLRATYRILLVDDEDAVRDVFFQTLQRAGHSVVSASSGDEAYEILKRDKDFELLVTDLVMPGGLQGDGLAKVSRDLIQDLPVILISGHAGRDVFEEQDILVDCLRLLKPVPREKLLDAIDAVMTAY